MATSQILQHLYSFNTSSPDFSRYLYHLIQSDGEDHYLLGLQGSDLIRAVDFLDKVRVPTPASIQLAKQTSQALAIIPTADDVSRLCLHRLQAICSHHGILPPSHIIAGGLIRVGDYPVASGGFADVWEGVHDNTKVCIKCPRITIRDRKDMEKVNGLHGTPISRLLNDTSWHIGILQGGDHVETIETSEYCSLHRRYGKSLAIYIGVDVERISNRLSWQEFGCESYRPGKSFLRS